MTAIRTPLRKAVVICSALTLFGCNANQIKESLPSLDSSTEKTSKETIGTGTGAVLGGIASAALCDDDYKGLCILAGTALGAYLGNQIGQYLDEQDKIKMAEATKKAIATGDAQAWQTAENKTSGSVKVIDTKTQQQASKVKVLKKKVKKVPPLDIIAETYKANKNANVRGGPSTDYEVVGKLKAAEYTEVVGKVKTSDWFMISQNGLGSGFVYSPLLSAAPDAEIETTEQQYDASDVSEEEVAFTQTCRTVEQSVTLADGSRKSETLEACQGLNGWEVRT